MAVVETGAAPTPKVEVRPRGASRREGWQRRLPLLPALIYIMVVTQIPFVVTLWYSFQNYFFDVPGGRRTSPGSATTRRSSPTRRSAGSLVRSVVMTVTAVIIAMVLGVAFAVLLDRKFLGRGVVRTLIITPFLVMPAAAALVWAGPMLDPNFGLLNYLLQPFGVHHVAWLSTYRAGLGDRGHDLAVDAVHDPDRAGRACRASRPTRWRRPRSTAPGRWPRSASSPSRTCGPTSSSASCSARSTWSTCSTRSG